MPLPKVRKGAAPSVSPWPAETDVVLSDGKNVLLTQQCSLLQAVIWDSFHHVHAALILHYSFPDIAMSSMFVKDALLAAADGRKPESALIHQRLQRDREYMVQISALVSSKTFYGHWTDVGQCGTQPAARISLFRSKFKGYFSELVSATVMKMSSPSLVQAYIEKQTCNYHYTYRTQGNVSILSSMNSI